MRTRKRRDRADDITDVGKLRKSRRGQERAHFEMTHSRAVFVPNPALLCRGRRKRFYKLQAISQTDLAQSYAIGGIDILNAGHASLTAVLPGGENSCFSNSERTAEESTPRTGTFNPSPQHAPSTAIRESGQRDP